MNRLALLREIERLRNTPPSLLEAARVVVALSGATKVAPDRQVFATSQMAITVLRKAIEREENPTFALAPEPINPGVL